MKPETTSGRIQTFDEFYPFFLREHSKPLTRGIHCVGTLIGISLGLYGIFTGQFQWLLIGIVTGYAFAWFSHFAIEKNKPAAFKYPIWSLISEMKMSGNIIRSFFSTR